jgi:hypothetical protein
MRSEGKELCKALARIAVQIGMLIFPQALASQTDFFNLDDDRPVAVEDAAPVERYEFDLQLAPARVEREAGGPTIWSLAPELAYGLLARTDLSLRLQLAAIASDDPAEEVSGVSGLEVILFHQLNRETLGLPALAVSGGLVFPVGGLAGESTHGTVKAIVSRSFRGVRRGMRIHANAAYTLADEDAAGRGPEARRWLAGVAVDRTFVFESLLIIANVFADRPLQQDADTRLIAGAGIRYQLSPRMAIDAGFERRISNQGPDWAFTLGTANAFSLRSLIPLGGP